jgi:hypothetical protein
MLTTTAQQTQRCSRPGAAVPAALKQTKKEKPSGLYLWLLHQEIGLALPHSSSSAKMGTPSVASKHPSIV